jgi:predicted nucleic acid-binding protein
MIDLLRRYQPALAWLATLRQQPLGIPGLVAMELFQGCRNAKEQQKLERVLDVYPLYWPSSTDCERALKDYLVYHLSNNLGVMDALIAQTAVGLEVPLVTFNEKHYRLISHLQIIQPYERE